MAYRNYYDIPYLIKNLTSDRKISPESFKHLTKQIQSSDFNEEICNSRMKECSEPTELEYGFRYTGSDDREHDTVYKISFTNYIISEELRCCTGKRHGIMFSINVDKAGNIDCKFNRNMIKNKTLYDEINETIQQFCGKFSLISILFNVITSKNKKYSDDNFSVHLIDFLHEIISINVIVNGISTQTYYQHGSSGMLLKLDKGSIPSIELENLIRSEKILCQFLTQTYFDIKFVEYEIIKRDDGYIDYTLMIDKMIVGKVRRIAIDEESSGTVQLLQKLSPLISSLNGMTVFIDDIDTNMHNILFRNIIDTFIKNITGQLIITTHNTTLLKYIDPCEAYIIDVDLKKQSVSAISDFGRRIICVICI